MVVIVAGFATGGWGLSRPRGGLERHDSGQSRACGNTGDFDYSRTNRPRDKGRTGDKADSNQTTGNSTDKPDDTTDNSNLPEDATAIRLPDYIVDKSNGRLTGTVVDSRGNPVQGAQVTASSVRAPPFEGLMVPDTAARLRTRLAAYDFEDRCRRKTTTDNQGRFAFTDLDENRRYTLNARHERGQASRTSVSPPGDVVLTLATSAILRLRLIGDSSPLREPYVSFGWHTAHGQHYDSVHQPDQDGWFELRVQPGTVAIVAKARGMYLEHPLEIEVPPEGLTHELKLSPAAMLSIKVVDDEGKPLPQVSVKAKPGIRNISEFADIQLSHSTSHATTNSAGIAEFTFLAPGPWTISASLPMGPEDFAATESSQADLELSSGLKTHQITLTTGLRLVVKCADSTGKPLEAGDIRFMSPDGDSNIYALRLPPRAAGTAEFIGLTKGRLTLIVMLPDSADIVRELDLVERVTEVHVTPVKGASLRGRLIVPGLKDASYYHIRLRRDNAPTEGSWHAMPFSTFTGKDGTYVIERVHTGEWTLEVNRYGREITLLKRQVVLEPGLNKLDLELEQIAWLLLTVKKPDGKPEAHFSVRLTGPSSGTLYDHGRNGEHTVAFVDPGEYRVIIQGDKLMYEQSRLVITPGANSLAVTLKQPDAMRIVAVTQDSLAERAGLRIGDLIVEYGGIKLEKYWDLETLVANFAQAQEIRIVIERAGQTQTITVRPGTLGVEVEQALRENP